MKGFRLSVILTISLFTMGLFAIDVVIKPKYKMYGDTPPVTVVKVYDGDTIHVDIKDWPDIIGHNIGVRVIGIDAPEMHDKNDEIKKEAIKARDFVKARVDEAKVVHLKNIGRDKYFRILAEVWLDDVNLSDLMISKGLAKPYDGGTKDKWLEEDIKGQQE